MAMMFHPDTRWTLDLWTAMADRADGIPARRDLDPGVLGPRLTRTFLIDAGLANLPVRLAGDWVESVHARALGQAAFADLWEAGSRPDACALALRTLREGRPAVLSAAFGDQPVQMTLAPLRGFNGAVDRLLGVYAPERSLVFSPRDRRALSFIGAEAVGEPRRAPLNLATRNGRRVA